MALERDNPDGMPLRFESGTRSSRSAPSSRQAVSLVVALPHMRLRDAIANALEEPGAINVVGRASDLAGAIRVTRDSAADTVVLGTGLLRGDAVGDLHAIVTALPDVHVIVVGTETSLAYGAVMRAAGATEYVALEHGAQALADAVRRAIPKTVRDLLA
jgi:DNA-binding NarL/FixJ family response regulator